MNENSLDMEDELGKNLFRTLRCVRRQLSNYHVHPLLNREKQIDKLTMVLEPTFAGHGSTFVLMLGIRGCGKSQTVRNVLDRLETSYSQHKVIRVYLSGLLLADDPAVVRDIIHQIYPERVWCSNQKQVMSLKFLEEMPRDSRTIIVLDDFDQFTGKSSTQWFIYALLDSMSKPDLFLGVIAITSHTDAVSHLSERMRSRLGQNIVNFSTPALSDENDVLKLLGLTLFLPKSFEPKSFQEQWNSSIEASLCCPDLRSRFCRLLMVHRDPGWWNSMATMALTRIERQHPCLTEDDFQFALNMSCVDHTDDLFAGLSLPELCVIVAMNNMQMTSDNPVVKSSFASLPSNTTVFKLPSALLQKAFQRLIALHIIERCSSSHDAPSEVERVRLTLEPERVLSLCKYMPTGLQSFAKGGWWKR